MAKEWPMPKEVGNFDDALEDAAKGLGDFSDSASQAARDADDFGSSARESKGSLSGLTSAAGGLLKAFGKASVIGAAAAVADAAGVTTLGKDVAEPALRAVGQVKSEVGRIREMGGDVSEEGIDLLLKRRLTQQQAKQGGFADVKGRALETEFLKQVVGGVRQNKLFEAAAGLFQ